MTEKNNLYGRYEKKLHYISNQEIEALAYGLIHRFNRDILKTPQPTPIDDILEFQIKEKHKIDFNIEDLIKKYPEQEVLGYFDIYGKKIVIDKTLYEDTSEIGERRCSFTISHEIGHYMVQGMRVEGHIRQMDLFEKPLKQEEDIILTRNESIDLGKDEKLDYKERQANYFAACLLMPREMVKKAMADRGYKQIIIAPGSHIEKQENGLFLYGIDFVKRTGIHDVFKVNVSAMGYRLLKLGLIKEEKGERG